MAKKSRPSKTIFLLVAMTSLLSLALLSFSLFLSVGDSAAAGIDDACNATRFPDVCRASLADAGGSPAEVVTAAIGVSAKNLKTAQGMVKSILDASSGNVNRSLAANNCLELLTNSAHRTALAGDAFSGGRKKDARAWMSAALLYQYDCWSALKYANDTVLVNQTMSFLDSLTGLSSNALSMLAAFDEFGADTATWRPPRTERDGFWESGPAYVSRPSTDIAFPSGLTADVTVCKAGCDFQKVQDAVNAAPTGVVPVGSRRFVIHIKAGLYEEVVRVGLDKLNVVFLGDGMGKTVISGSVNVGQPGVSTYNTATVGVLGDGFMAKGLTIQNTAGPDVHQAVAFRSDSDLSLIEGCEFLANQDTLYAHSLRQLYKSCRIQGNVDFIFGNAAAVFQNCDILVAPRQLKPEKGEKNAVTAQGRTDPAETTGFVFQNCLVNGTEAYMRLLLQNPKVHRNYLGRPWKEYARTVFIGCRLERLISPEGWLPWKADFALATLYYGEIGNSGPGSGLAQRVNWSSRVPPQHVDAYSVANFIQGDEWISGRGSGSGNSGNRKSKVGK